MKKQVTFSMQEALKIIGDYVLDNNLLGDANRINITLELDTAGKPSGIIVEER